MSLQAPNLFHNPDRIDILQNKIIQQDDILLVSGKYAKLKNSQYNLDQIKLLRNHKPRTSYYFKDINNKKYRLSEIQKTPEFGSNRTINSNGKALADAGERSTILSLYKNISKPEDTNEQIFIDNPDAFRRWKNTFQQTKQAIDTLIKCLDNYTIIHDSESNAFTDTISLKCSQFGISPHSWNPSDMWIVSKFKQNDIIQDILDCSNVQELNDLVYSLYKNKQLFPISLKQITSNFQVEHSNIPGIRSETYYVKINNFITDLSPGTKEIGTISFINTETNLPIRMQNKGFPFSSMNTQTEITSDGSETGGRIGKIPTKIIDQVYEEYGFSRIMASSYFCKDLSETPEEQIQEWVKYFNLVTSHDSVQTENDISNIEESIKRYISSTDYDIIQAFKHKIQGLAMQYFFIKNESHLDDIMTKFILGAKKINPDASFFIKIY